MHPSLDKTLIAGMLTIQRGRTVPKRHCERAALTLL